jgi:hypothetical protein
VRTPRRCPPNPSWSPRRNTLSRPLTGYELSDYRRLLERAIEGISPGAPVQAALRAKLDAVLAEQDDRARMAAGA